MVLNPQAKLLVWDKIRDEKCTLCILHKEAQSVCLLGDGPVPSHILLVGEAPGKREDDIARPFSGVAGQYLDRVLGEVGLPRDSVYITNSVRCRPPDNRTPTPSEIKACSGFMQSEIEIVNPDYILVMGNAALKSILNTSGIMSKRGTAKDISIAGRTRTVFSTVHPAAVLRNPGLENTFKSDLLAFKRLTEGSSQRPETKTALVQNSKGLARLCAMLAQVETPIAFDVETGSTDPNEDEGGLHPWSPNGVIHTVAFCWEPGRSYVISLEHPATTWDIPIKRVYEALNVALAGKKMVGHNIKFDAEWMKAKGVEVYSHFCTRIARHLLDENGPGGLKALARTYLGADEYEAGISFGANPTALARLAIYNGKDADYTLRLYHNFKQQLTEHPRLARLFLKLMMPASRAFVGIEANGFPVDIERLEQRHAETNQKITEITAALLLYVPQDQRLGFNFRSPIQLGWLLFEHLKLPLLVISPKSGRPSTAESVLLQLRERHPVVNLLMELRKWQKYESTYTRNWLSRVAYARESRLYTSYNLSGTVTGRLSSNMQQVPRDLFIRGIIGTGPGWKLIEADFAQVELRIAAMFSSDPGLTAAFNESRDPHTETASQILGKSANQITKEERKMAKAVAFGFLYGMGWRKFKIYAKEKYDLIVSDTEAQEYRKAFFIKYKGLLPWHDRQRRIVRNMQQVQSPIGRIRHLPAVISTDESVQAEAEREAINAPVQGFASDLTVLSMVILSESLDKERCRIIGNVHDSILFEVADEYCDEAAGKIKSTMENLPLRRMFGYTPNIKIEAEVTIGTHWGEHQ